MKCVLWDAVEERHAQEVCFFFFFFGDGGGGGHCHPFPSVFRFKQKLTLAPIQVKEAAERVMENTGTSTPT
jgi:hypothetical protein